LEEAYQLTHDLEYSEVNTVFEFIMEEFIAPDVQREFVAEQLKKHIARLDEFPQVYRVLGNTPSDHP
jgi:hypothetical protein